MRGREGNTCTTCPLAGQKRVVSRCEVEKPIIAIVGEAPGREEEAEGKPFVGASGRLLNQAMGKAGIMRHQVYVCNVVECRPPKNDIKSAEGQRACACCMPGFKAELASMKRMGIKVIIALGATAMEALGIQGSMKKQRGSVSIVDDMVVIPTWHPSYIMRGNWNEEVTWVNDFLKAREIAIKGWKAPNEYFTLFPTLSDVLDFAGSAMENNTLLAIDIETTNLNPYWSDILMIGVATDDEHAMVIPFTSVKERDGSKEIVRYWKPNEELTVKEIVRKMFAKCPALLHNAVFDMWHLKRHGMPILNFQYDTMLLHHAINPELPHDLSYIVSIYGKTPQWKEVVLNSMDKMKEISDEVVRTYNARDCVVLHQVLPGLFEDLEAMGTKKTYWEFSKKLVPVIVDISDYGFAIDIKGMKSKNQKLKRIAEQKEKAIKTLCNLPDGFNVSSQAHLRQLFFGVKAYDLRALKAEWQEYEDNPKRKRNTKKYQDLVEKIALVEGITSFELSDKIVHKTESKLASMDSEALLQVQRYAINRLETLSDIVRKTEKHREEELKLNRVKELIGLLYEYREADKLLSTFTGFPVAQDGRVHAFFKIHGTATGRLSSSDPNLQNIPGEVQDVFVASPGMVLLKADYSNIELRVLAYLADENIMIDTFERGENIHDLNTKLLFGIDKNHPQWKEIRRAAKVYVFGRSYGGTVEGIYKQVITDVPELQLTFAHFKECDRRYFEKLSKYKAWCDAMIQQAIETRVVETAFGRKRVLNDTIDKIQRQALNTPIQGTAGEICIMALIKLHELFKKNTEWNAHIVCTVHDSILVECNESQGMKVAQAMKEVMEAKVKLGKRTVSIPVDIGIGKTWAETDKDENKVKL